MLQVTTSLHIFILGLIVRSLYTEEELQKVLSFLTHKAVPVSLPHVQEMTHLSERVVVAILRKLVSAKKVLYKGFAIYEYNQSYTKPQVPKLGEPKVKSRAVKPELASANSLSAVATGGGLTGQYVEKLNLLRTIKNGHSVFADSPLLNLMIADYEYILYPNKGADTKMSNAKLNSKR